MDNENLQFLIWFAREALFCYMESLPAFSTLGVNVPDPVISTEYGGRLIIYQDLRMLLVPEERIEVLDMNPGGEFPSHEEVSRKEFMERWMRNGNPRQ